MRKIIVGSLVALALVGAYAVTRVNTVEQVSGVASDHSHVVSFEQFKRVVAGHGGSLSSLDQAYADTTRVCTIVMTSRWQDRPVLLSALPGSIQDPTRRDQVYSAVLSTVQNPAESACVA